VVEDVIWSVGRKVVWEVPVGSNAEAATLSAQCRVGESRMPTEKSSRNIQSPEPGT
jgi:hypothetical protein